MSDKTLVLDHEDKIRLLDGQIYELRRHIAAMAPMHNANTIIGAIGVLLFSLILSAFICFVLFGHDRFTSLMAILVTLTLTGTGLHFFSKMLKKRVKME